VAPSNQPSAFICILALGPPNRLPIFRTPFFTTTNRLSASVADGLFFFSEPKKMISRTCLIDDLTACDILREDHSPEYVHGS
jgi:hypothetical protein